MSAVAEPPWREAAVAVQRGTGDEGEIIAEGLLGDVAQMVRNLSPVAQYRVRISLPDRGAPPFSYGGSELLALLALLPTI